MDSTDEHIVLPEAIKDLEEKLYKTEKQRNALIIALNYVNNTMIAMKWALMRAPMIWSGSLKMHY